MSYTQTLAPIHAIWHRAKKGAETVRGVGSLFYFIITQETCGQF